MNFFQTGEPFYQIRWTFSKIDELFLMDEHFLEIRELFFLSLWTFLSFMNIFEFARFLIFSDFSIFSFFKSQRLTGQLSIDQPRSTEWDDLCASSERGDLPGRCERGDLGRPSSRARRRQYLKRALKAPFRSSPPGPWPRPLWANWAYRHASYKKFVIWRYIDRKTWFSKKKIEKCRIFLNTI